MKLFYAFVAASSFSLGACGPDLRHDPGGGDDGTTDAGPGSGTPKECNKMDIVFVVDDSGSMAEEQSNLGQNFPMFATLLSQYTTSNGEHLDFRIGVTTTGRDIDYTISLGMGLPDLPMSEKGDNGALRNNCGPQARWLDQNDANLPSDLGCRASVGTGGPSIEMPMLMGKWALEDHAMTNSGFLRDDALLALVMLTDEDDQSTDQNNFTIDATGSAPITYNPSDHVAYLDQLKGNRTRWAAAAIAGDGDCSSSFGMASDATRLKEFVNDANSSSTQAVFSSICDGDLSIGLKKAIDTFSAACGDVIF